MSALINTNSKILEYKRPRAMGYEQEFGVITQCVEQQVHKKQICDSCWRWEIPNSSFFSNGAKIFTENGASLYKDREHPEGATPETSDPLELTLYELAVRELIKKTVRGTQGQKVRLFNDNTDSYGASYGSHENYCLKHTDMERFAEFFTPFVSTRMIIIGNGSINPNGKYEISQRARYILKSTIDSLHIGVHEKPLFHIKNEPLADPNKYHRLHLVCGNSNMLHVPSYLKFGMTALVLDWWEDNNSNLEEILKFFGSDEVSVFHQISLDLSLKKKYEVFDSKTSNRTERSAIEIQKFYQKITEQAYNGRDAITDDILKRWKNTLDTLEENPMEADWLDWVMKKKILNSYIAKTGKSLGDAGARSIDTNYFNLEEKEGIFYWLKERKMIELLFTDEQIERATNIPPKKTRALLRSNLINDNSAKKISLKDLCWDKAEFIKEGKEVKIEFLEPLEKEAI